MGDAEKYMPGGYLLIQSALLFSHYGLGYVLPWWVLWFPSLLMPVFIAFALLVAFITALATK